MKSGQLSLGILFSVWMIEIVSAANGTALQRAAAEYFARTFRVTPACVQIEIIHPPKIDSKRSNDQPPVLKTKNSQPRLGHQTLWVVSRDAAGHMVETPMTLTVAIETNVVIAKTTLGRGEGLNPDNTGLQTMRIDRDYDKYLFDREAIDGLTIRQVLPQGSPILNHMLQPRPDVANGTIVEVQIQRCSLVVVTRGRIKGDAFIGDRVRVMCEGTGKLITGKLETPQMVVVGL